MLLFPLSLKKKKKIFRETKWQKNIHLRILNVEKKKYCIFQILFWIEIYYLVSIMRTAAADPIKNSVVCHYKIIRMSAMTTKQL